MVFELLNFVQSFDFLSFLLFFFFQFLSIFKVYWLFYSWYQIHRDAVFRILTSNPMSMFDKLSFFQDCALFKFLFIYPFIYMKSVDQKYPLIAISSLLPMLLHVLPWFSARNGTLPRASMEEFSWLGQDVE